jgi:hypothetical protein
VTCGWICAFVCLCVCVCVRVCLCVVGGGANSADTETAATPWAHQKAFMAALQQQMRSDGDAL